MNKTESAQYIEDVRGTVIGDPTPFDYRRAARDIQFQTGCTYDDARFEAKSWARRNGYDY